MRPIRYLLDAYLTESLQKPNRIQKQCLQVWIWGKKVKPKKYLLFHISKFFKYGYLLFLRISKANEMNISFTIKQEEYIADQVASGEYQNNSEVIRDALRLHGIYRDKVIQDLRKEIEKGWNGPDSNRSMKEIIASKKRE